YVEKISAASSITGRRRRSRSVSMTSGGFMARCRSRASSSPPPEDSALRECLSSVPELGRMRCVNVELPYGETTLTATLPSRTRTLSNVEATTLAPLEDLGAAVRAALAAPRGLPRIGELVRPGAGVTIAFDDATVASYGPIRVTHTPDGMSMSVHGNRMHEVLDEMGRHLERRVGRRVFKIDTLLADPWRPAKVVAGSVDATRRELLGDVARMFPARRGQAGERFDVLVYGVPDTSPYAVFSHVNPILTLVSSGLGYLGGLAEAAGSPGCTVIMATPVPDRWDRPTHPSYPEVWERVLPVTRDP